jgi:hypothetical protein
MNHSGTQKYFPKPELNMIKFRTYFGSALRVVRYCFVTYRIAETCMRILNETYHISQRPYNIKSVFDEIQQTMVAAQPAQGSSEPVTPRIYLLFYGFVTTQYGVFSVYY